MSNTVVKKNILDVYIEGSRKGYDAGILFMLHYVTMAYMMIIILRETGILDLLEVIFGPVMAIVGLPGAAIAVLAAAWMSMSGGVGVAVALYGQGVLDAGHLAVLLPGIYLMGSQLQYYARLVCLMDPPKKHHPFIILNSIVLAFIAMFTLNILY